MEHLHLLPILPIVAYIPSTNLEISLILFTACVINNQILSILPNKCLPDEIPSLHSTSH